MPHKNKIKLKKIPLKIVVNFGKFKIKENPYVSVVQLDSEPFLFDFGVDKSLWEKTGKKLNVYAY